MFGNTRIIRTFTSSETNKPVSIMKTTSLDKSQIKAAEILGVSDFNNGIKSVPSLSASCRSLLEINRDVKGASIVIMKAWLKGWHKANLSKVVLN